MLAVYMLHNDHAKVSVINLRILSKATTDTFLETRELYYQIHAQSGWIPTFVRRWWYIESRHTMMKSVSKLVKNAVHSIEFCDPSEVDVESLKNALAQSRKGLRHLITKYREDAYTSSRLEILCNDIDQVCGDFEADSHVQLNNQPTQKDTNQGTHARTTDTATDTEAVARVSTRVGLRSLLTVI